MSIDQKNGSFLFGHIRIKNKGNITFFIILLSSVFFAYTTNLKRDYEEKLSSVAGQVAANTNLILSFFEEEIEMFINKNKVEESLDSFQIDATNFVRIDSTSFEEIIIFNGKEPVYVSGTEYVEFYRELILTTNFDDAMKDKNNRWLISEKKDEPLPNYGMISYVRTLFDSDTNEKCGYVIATVSANQLDNLRSLSGGYQNSSEREFLPHSVGISIDDKILFLGENIVKKGKIIFDKENFQADGNELYFVNISNENEFFTIHSTKALTNKILVILSLFILVFAATTLTSYKILIFLLNEICGRINKLNYKIEMSSPTKEETK